MDASQRGYSVLVADDSPVYRKLVEHALESEPCSLIFARTGQEAIDLFAKHLPSVVITDWMMPDFAGVELCERIRAVAKRGCTYIIVLTGKTEKDDLVKGLAAGADDYLTKPFDRSELLARIGVGLRNVALHREIEGKNRQLEELAHTDVLTGLANRRAIEEWAQRQLRGAARHGFPLWVVQSDLDNFKRINDTYGHDAGDAVLRKFGELLRHNTRASDISGRMGGDEFLLVISHVNEEQIRLTVERLREQFTSTRFKFEGAATQATASFGIAGFLGQGTPDLNALVKQADTALYAAKAAGGNRIQLAAAKVVST
jgi:two-component system cell cycle response regulator